MKTSRVCGWAVIFTVTLLLAACASHTPQVATTDVMSGPDATMIQPTDQQSLENRENAVLIQQAWLDEREMRLDQREDALDRRENALTINQAWLDERELALTRSTPDLTKQEDILAFKEAWLDEREMLVGQMEDRAALAAASDEPGSYAFKVDEGRCYASIFVPAQYRTVAVTKPIEVPKGDNFPVLYQTVTEQVKISDEETRWEEVLCGDQMTTCRITEIQRSLHRGGYNPGPIDGVIGPKTMAAVNAFQKDFNLTVANHLTTETVRALDANF